MSGSNLFGEALLLVSNCITCAVLEVMALSFSKRLCRSCSAVKSAYESSMAASVPAGLSGDSCCARCSSLSAELCAAARLSASETVAELLRELVENCAALYSPLSTIQAERDCRGEDPCRDGGEKLGMSHSHAKFAGTTQHNSAQTACRNPGSTTWFR